MSNELLGKLEGTAPSPAEKYKILLKAEGSLTSPMPSGSTDEGYVLSIKGSGTEKLPVLSFESPGAVILGIQDFLHLVILKRGCDIYLPAKAVIHIIRKPHAFQIKIPEPPDGQFPDIQLDSIVKKEQQVLPALVLEHINPLKARPL